MHYYKSNNEIMQYCIVSNDIALIMHYRALLKRSDAKHRKELVKFQHLLITYNPLDETTSKKQTNKKKKKLVGEDIFFLPAIWFYICNIVYKLQHSIFPRKKEIYIQNAIVCQNWKFETALECAYQLSIYLGMSTSTYE